MNAEQLAGSLGRYARKPGGGFMAQCPAHDDQDPSLSIDDGDDGRVLFKCMAGCKQSDVLEALKTRGLWPTKDEAPQGPPQVVGTFIYHDAEGRELYCKERIEPGRNGRRKEFRFKQPGGSFGRGDSGPVLYGLPAAIKARSVIMTEGEQHADLLASWGLPATTLDSGAQSKPTPAMIEQLSGKRIVILPDNDKPGREYAHRLAVALHAKAESLKVVELPDLPKKGDIIDWAQAAGNDRARLLELIKAAPEWEPMSEADQDDENAPGAETERQTPYQLATSTADLRKLEIKTEYLVEGLIPKDMITLFYAPSGMGKSTLANQICQTVQNGEPFLNLPTMKTPVFYLDYENPLPTIVERLRKIGDGESFPLWHHGSDVAPPQIDRQVNREILFDIAPGTLLVVDTLKASNDADENKATDMKPVFDFFKALRRHGLTIVILHHTSKGPEGNYRGSTVIQDQSDHCISLAKVKAPGSDQEADDEDEANTYRFGTRGKTRARPFKMYLEFDLEKELFVLAEDPAMAQMQRIKEAIERIGKRQEVANQKRIIEELQKDDEVELSQQKIRGLLKRGTGVHWKAEKGLHNATIYTPIPVFQFSGPIYSQKTEKLIPADSDHLVKKESRTTGGTPQDIIKAEFVGFSQFSKDNKKPADAEPIQEVLTLTVDDFEEVL